MCLQRVGPGCGVDVKKDWTRGRGQANKQVVREGRDDANGCIDMPSRTKVCGLPGTCDDAEGLDLGWELLDGPCSRAWSNSIS